MSDENMKESSKVIFATMKPWKLFFIVAIPGMISMFAMSVYSIIEGIFIGQKLGEEAFAAVNIAFPIIMVNFSLSDLVGVGASVPISIALGRKDEKTANNVFSCSVVMIFITAIIMGFVMFFAAEPLSRFMGADETLLDTSVRYIQTYALFSPMSAIYFAMDNYLRISGYVKTSMFINIFCNVMMLIMLVIFLIVLDMDVVGSALSACIAMCICSALAMIPFLRGKAILKFTRPHFSLHMVKEIAACGTPVFLSNIAGRITSILINISLITLGAKLLGEGGGTTAVAAYAVLMYSSDSSQPLLYGMSDSLSPALGFNWGAENYDRVKKIAVCNFIGAAIVSVAATVAMYLFAPSIVSLFVEENDTVLLALSSRAMRIFCFAYLVRWFSIVAQNFLSAIEKPVHATIMSVSIAFIFPTIMLGTFWNLELDGIWLNMLGTSVLSGILAVILLLDVQRKIKKCGYETIKSTEGENNEIV